MRTAITTATVDGKTKLLAGIEIPADKQRAAFEKIDAPGATEVQFWASDGSVKRRKIQPQLKQAKSTR